MRNMHICLMGLCFNQDISGEYIFGKQYGMYVF